MRRLLNELVLAGVFVVAVALLCGCATLGGVLPDGVPAYQVRALPAITCGDFLDRVDPNGEFKNGQQRAAVKACEDLQRGTTIKPGAVLGVPSS